MPRKAIDYSKSCIYKICCKDAEIKDIYIGSTTDLVRRKYEHKRCCNDDKKKNYNLPVYQFIRQNGGFDNWEVVKITDFQCNSSCELQTEERRVFEEMSPTLNTNRPIISKVEMKEYQEEYRKVNKDKIKEKNKEYREANIDKIKQKKKEYREANKEKMKEKDKEYREANKDKIKEYREANKDKMKEYQEEYYQNNKDKNNEKVQCKFCGSVLNRSSLKKHQKTAKKCLKLQEN